MNAERKRVSADWNEKIDVRSSIEYENAYDEMFEVDELFEEIEDQICSAGLPGTGYVSIRENIRQSWENHQALEAFTTSLTDYMDSKLDRPFASGLNKGAVHTLSLIKMEDFKTYKTGNLGHGYYDHGNLYSNQGSGYALTFQDFLGIAGNGAEGEAEYMGGQVTVNDNYVRSFAEVYKKQYETFGDKSVTLEEYLNELYSSGEFVHKRDQPVKEFLSSLLDMAPVAGSVKNFIEMGTGKDIITGDELTQTEQRTKTLRMLADVVAMEFALGDIGTGFHDGMRVDYQIGKDKLGELNGAKVIAESDYAFHMDGLSSYNGGMYSKFGEMSWTEGERYSSFLKNGSSDGLTDLEVQAARKAEDQIVLNKIDGDEVLKVRGGSKTSYGKSNLNLLKNTENFADASIESGRKTNFDNEIPRSGSEWNEYLKGKYGADNVHWNINSVDDVFSDPTRLKGYTADELQKVLGNDWTRGVYGSNGGGWKLMNGDISIFYHPGGGKHGGSYYGISSGATGKIKVVNPETYIPLKGDKATIIYD